MIEQTKHGAVFTTSYQYGSSDEEYIFACKGRPFAVLLSNNLPTPVSTLIDHHMVRDLGLKISNLQCRKFCFAGHKMRILGQVSTAVQCITNGKTSGGFHLKGLVVTNLDQLLDTQVVAGIKMKEKIKNNERKCETAASDNSMESDDSDDSEVSTRRWRTSSSPPDSPSDPDHSVVSTRPLELQLLAADSTTVPPPPMVSSSTITAATMSSPTLTSSSTPSLMTCSASSGATMSASSETTMSASSPCVSPPRMPGYRVSQAQSSYRSKLPIVAYRDPVAIHYWAQSAELHGHIIDKSDRDDKPRITNLKDGRKLRVGVWSQLDDPLATRTAIASSPTSARLLQIVSVSFASTSSATSVRSKTQEANSTAGSVVMWLKNSI